MQKCSSCGADIPENARFCGKCGSVQNTGATSVAATRSNTPPQSWMPEDSTIVATWSPYINNPAQDSAPAWSPHIQEPITPPPTPTAESEDEDERGGGIPPWSPLYGAALGGDALLGSGQIYTPGAPVVQGTPQIGSVPGVTGTPPPYTNAPASPPAPGNAPVTNPIQGPGNASISHPIQGPTHAPISHPVQGPVHAPVTHPIHGPVNTPHPQPGPQPIHQPPEQPEPSPTHKHHRHHKEHEHQQHQTHPAHHELHRVAHVAKVGGGSTVKTIILVVTAVAVVAAGGIAAAVHFLSHPQPLISVISNYTVGNTPAGANGTVLHISGQKFSSNSAITFLLDGQAAPGNPGTQSDSNGNFSTNITITNAWSVGTHTLTARDASNYITQKSVSVTVVQPGQANTPGPGGAPPDDATFRLQVTNAANVADPFSSNPVLVITGHPDPEGGTVCSPDDSGQSFTFNETTTGNTPFTKMITATCSGTYKAGQISYIETTTSLENSYQSNGVNVKCVLSNATVDLRLTGSYVGNNTFKGTVSSPYFAYTCDPQGYTMWHEASQGVTWTATIVTK
jgi:hypothetical protein